MYSEEFKAKALKVLAECDYSFSKAAQKLGMVSVRTLRRWRADLENPAWRRQAHLTVKQRRSIARLLEDGEAASALAREHGVSVTTVYNIRNEHRAKGAVAFMGEKEGVDVPETDLASLPDDVEALKKRCAELELDNAILSQTIAILKKDPGVDPSGMADREKTTVIGALGNRFSVSALCGKPRISRSSYYYAKAASCAPDRYARDRRRIRSIFDGSGKTFGSGRIWMALRQGWAGGARFSATATWPPRSSTVSCTTAGSSGSVASRTATATP